MAFVVGSGIVGCKQGYLPFSRGCAWVQLTKTVTVRLVQLTTYEAYERRRQPDYARVARLGNFFRRLSLTMGT
jgi:hypothetical protein